MIYNPASEQYETIAQLRREFQNTTIPRNPNSEQLAEFGRVYVEPVPAPEGDVVTQGQPEQGEDGVWRQTWNVRDYTPEELAEQRTALLPALEEARKAAEAEGVTINGIRYAGSPDNRAALSEVLQFAQASQQTMFAMWKDSAGQWHADHPVSEVEQALMAIGQRRGALIALEGHYAAQLQAGEIDGIEGLSWEV